MVEAVLVGLGLLLLMAAVVGVPVIILFHGGRRQQRRDANTVQRSIGNPIERLGADLRRLRHQIQHSDHRSATQYAALRQAYDGVLIETCAMLELSHDLDRPTVGTERDIERLRVEAMLEGNGIVLSTSRRYDQRA